MLTTLLCSILLLQLLGALAMVVKMRRAPVGYEDAAGFHRGAEPLAAQPLGLTLAAVELPGWGSETHRLAS